MAAGGSAGQPWAECSGWSEDSGQPSWSRRCLQAFLVLCPPWADYPAPPLPSSRNEALSLLSVCRLSLYLSLSPCSLPTGQVSVIQADLQLAVLPRLGLSV